VFRAAALGFLLVSVAFAPAAAQVPRDDPSALAAMRFGPLALTPTLALRDVGLDTNVLGQPESDPEFTMAFVPGADAWLRLGRLRFGSKTELEWLYFQETANQRAFSVTETATMSLPLSYVAPYVTGVYENTKRRQNAEIDFRLRQKTTAWAAGVTMYPGPRTDVDLQYRRSELRFDDELPGEVFFAPGLDRDNAAVQAEARYAVTPLTSAVARIIVERDRFVRSPIRDADSWTVLPGFDFRPSALISGTAFVGYRKFDSLAPGRPDFAGLVASVDLKYVARDMTKVEARAARNVEYSFEPAEPFYVQTDWHLTLTQAVSYEWDVRAQAGRVSLDFERFEGAALSGRVDRIWVYGVGMGRRFGIELRVGIDVLFTRRESELAGRSYEGYKVGGSVTYGY